MGTMSVGAQDTLRVRRGSEIAIPVGSWLLPGLGQYLHGKTGTGNAYTAVFVGGVVLGMQNPTETTFDFPRDDREQLGHVGWQFASGAMWLSGWDAFNRALPGLKSRGKYEFLRERERLPQLITAPFDYRFLKRWTTWVDIAQTGLIAGLILSERDPNRAHYPFRFQDAAYATSLSANAAIGEEAFFRGYLLPMMHQKMGQRFWLANASQAALFAAGHVPDNAALGAYFAGWAMWEGWLVRRNDWSIRESIFHHFWYDLAVVSAAAIAEDKPQTVRIRFPGLRF